VAEQESEQMASLGVREGGTFPHLNGGRSEADPGGDQRHRSRV
jgi:hypothetical protein